VFGLLLGDGDDGLGPVEAAIAYEQLGSHLAPGPVLWTVLAAPLVPGAATGEVVVGGVLAEQGDLVEHATDLDVVLVVGDDTVVAHRLASVEPLDPLDPLTPVGRCRYDGPGEVVGAASGVRELGTLLSAAMLSGIAARALEVARGYALERHQFDVPIGSFQAVKHLLADMYVRAGLAQSATYAAAATGGDPTGAKVLAAEAAITNAGTAVQVLGGMGFTWDMLPNHLLKRAWVLEHAFGAGDDRAALLGSALVERVR
jgi:hypothetical protein